MTVSAPTRPRLLGAVWALLAINTLGSQGAVTILSVPQAVYQLVTMGSLLAAFTIALLLNPRLRIRPNAFCVLLSLLLLVSLVSTARLEAGAGGLFRCGRFALFIATLWLVTPWWGAAMTFVRHHVRTFAALLVPVVLGLLVAPGYALPETYDGRIVGAIWPLTPPQVGQYAAVVVGLVAVLWLTRRTDRTSVLLLGVPAVGLLLLSYTRTATIGVLAGLTLAGLALILTSTRARRFLGVGVLVAVVAAVAFAPAITAWLRRGQDDESFGDLTGRQKVWDALLAAPRDTGEYLFGTGLSNKTFGGLPIDSSWLAVFHEQGVVGVGIVVIMLGTLLVTALLRPPSPARACAVFLIVYCAFASYTEVGLGDASPYLLHLAVAAALLATPDSPLGSVDEPREEAAPQAR